MLRMRDIATMMLGMVLSAGPALAADADWSTWQGPTHDNKSPDTGLLKEWPAGGPKLLWKRDDIGKGFATVAVSGGLVYTTGDIDSKLYIFATDMDGKPVWKVEHGAGFNNARNYPGSRSAPTIDGDNLYMESGPGVVGCFDAKTGSGPKWTRRLVGEFGGKQPSWGFTESVLIYKDMAIVTPGGKNCFVALDKNTGKDIWRSEFSGSAHYSSILPVEYQGATMLVAGTGDGLVCFDPATGKTIYTNPFCKGNTANIPTPAFSDGYIFWANGYGKGGVCIKASVTDGKWSFQEAWTTKDMVCHHGGYVILDGYIYGNNNDGWTCLDLKTGEKKWSNKGVGKGSILYADGMFYLFGEKDGLAGLAAASPAGLQMKGKFNVAGSQRNSWAHPVVIGGRLYLRFEENLYCFDVKAGQ